MMVSKANHDKRICGHDKHNVGISLYLCADVTSEEEKEKKKKVAFSFSLSVSIGICSLFFLHTLSQDH